MSDCFGWQIGMFDGARKKYLKIFLTNKLLYVIIINRDTALNN